MAPLPRLPCFTPSKWKWGLLSCWSWSASHLIGRSCSGCLLFFKWCWFCLSGRLPTCGCVHVLVACCSHWGVCGFFFLPRRNIKHHTFLQQLNSTQLNSVLVRHSSARLTRRGPPSHWAGRLPPKVKFMSWACEFQPWSAPPRPADDSQVVGGIQTFSLVLCFFFWLF